MNGPIQVSMPAYKQEAIKRVQAVPYGIWEQYKIKLVNVLSKNPLALAVGMPKVVIILF